MPSSFAEVPLAWRASVRIVPAWLGPIATFERHLPADDALEVDRLVAALDPTVRSEAGDLSLVAPTDWITGRGATPIMAAFTLPGMGRFSDESAGAYYAALTLRTSIAETRYHARRRFLYDAAPATTLEMRVLHADIVADVHDARRASTTHPELYADDPSDYAPAQAIAHSLRGQGSDGIVYDSVRDVGGTCVAIFRPPCVTAPVETAELLRYRWNPTRAEIDVERAMPL